MIQYDFSLTSLYSNFSLIFFHATTHPPLYHHHHVTLFNLTLSNFFNQQYLKIRRIRLDEFTTCPNLSFSLLWPTIFPCLHYLAILLRISNKERLSWASSRLMYTPPPNYYLQIKNKYYEILKKYDFFYAIKEIL